MSGVTVARTIISISAAGTPLAASSFLAASVPRCDAGHSWIGVMALGDAGARANPFVGGIGDLLQIEIGHHARRNVSGHSGDLRGNASAHYTLHYPG